MSIPLTIDWATLNWLQLRLRCWWHARARLGVVLWCLLGAGGGCIPATQLEETQSAVQVESEGRRRAEQHALDLATENAQLRAQMQEEKRAIDERDQALSQAELDTSAQGKQRQEAEGMVEQLRGELSRVGSHLQTFRDDKQKLEQALVAEAARSRALVRLSRDVSLLLDAPLTSGEYTLDAEQTSLVLRTPRAQALSDAGEVKPEAARLLDAVARVMQLHKQAKLRVFDASAPADSVRVARLVDALGDRGVAAGRIEALDAEASAVETADGVELVFAFSVP